MDSVNMGPGSNNELDDINNRLTDFIEESNKRMDELQNSLTRISILPIMTNISQSVAGIKKSLDSTNKAIKQFKPQEKNKISDTMAKQISRIRNSHLR